jgi:hypothetical protein
MNAIEYDDADTNLSSAITFLAKTRCENTTDSSRPAVAKAPHVQLTPTGANPQGTK